MSEAAAEIPVREGSGNVFSDLDLPDADELWAKAQLAAEIAAAIHDRGLTQDEAAEQLGTSQPTVSNLVRGRLRGFSFDRLVNFLNVFGRDVEIRVGAGGSGQRIGRTSVELDR